MSIYGCCHYLPGIKNILVQNSIITEFAQNHTRMENKELVCMVPKGK